MSQEVLSGPTKKTAVFKQLNKINCFPEKNVVKRYCLFQDTSDTVNVTVELTGFDETDNRTLHGFHIHQTGKNIKLKKSRRIQCVV